MFRYKSFKMGFFEKLTYYSSPILGFLSGLTLDTNPIISCITLAVGMYICFVIIRWKNFIEEERKQTN